MIKIIIPFLFCILFNICAICEQTDSLAIHYANTIKSNELNELLKVLASKDFEGRETGKPGQKKAAQYISHFFDVNHLSTFNQEGYFQQFPTTIKNPFNTSISINSQKLNLFEDYYFSPEFNDTTFHADSIVFIGYGINDSAYSDYLAYNNTKNKVALILTGEPINKKGKSYLSGTEYMSKWSYDRQQKLDAAKAMGVKVLFVFDEEFKEKKDIARHVTKSKMVLDIEENNVKNPAVFYISKKVANELLKGNKEYHNIVKLKNKINRTRKPVSFTAKVNVDVDIKLKGEKVSTENVIGFVEGTDLKDQIIVISAHYDHLGKKDSIIYYGADDDGSGTSALLELAQAFSLAKKDGHGPRRSILFIAFSGEEKGLLGSKYYTRFPLFPLDSTVADINIDMIGRIDTAHSGNPNYVYVIGSDKLSSELHTINEEKNKLYTHLQLDYKFNDPTDQNRFYYRSDHYNFAKNNIPVIFFFNGVHQDYHKPTDTIDKINFDKIETISRLVFYTAWELANRDERIKVDSNKP